MDIEVFLVLFPLWFIFGGLILIFELALVTQSIALLNKLKLSKIDLSEFYYGKLSVKLLLIFILLIVINAFIFYISLPLLPDSICDSITTPISGYKRCFGGMRPGF